MFALYFADPDTNSWHYVVPQALLNVAPKSQTLQKMLKSQGNKNLTIQNGN